VTRDRGAGSRVRYAAEALRPPPRSVRQAETSTREAVGMVNRTTDRVRVDGPEDPRLVSILAVG